MVLTPSTMLPLGTKAPAFSLPDPSGKTVSLSDFAGKPALLVVFMCNHCPYVKHIRAGLAQLARDYLHRGVAMVGISWLFSPSGKGPHGAWEGQYIGANGGGVWGNPTSASYETVVPLVSDIRLKRDITLIGQLDDGLSLYSYRYLWSDTVYVGVMAQEVAAKMPSAAVVGDDGYLRVDYSKLGLRMRTLEEWQALTYGIRL